MSGTARLGLIIIASVVAIGIALKILSGLLAWLWAVVVPIAIVASVGLLIYGFVSKKALGGNRRVLR